jgi:hypothetical protein
MTSDSIISKVWGFHTTLRDDGVGYGDECWRMPAGKRFGSQR